ncbi:hypothetical protein MTP99_002147 [Tenebrio molitor]|nr:hypothetical protein MTP99_002147 [Tenebrio molitor]
MSNIVGEKNTRTKRTQKPQRTTQKQNQATKGPPRTHRTQSTAPAPSAPLVLSHYFRNFTEDKSSITPKLGLHFSLQETVITFRQKIIANDEAVLSVINHNPRKYRRNAKAVQRITPENESFPLTRLDKMAAAAIFRPFPITEYTTQFTLVSRLTAIFHHFPLTTVRSVPLSAMLVRQSDEDGGIDVSIKQLQKSSMSWDPFGLLNESEIEVSFALSLVRRV